MVKQCPRCLCYDAKDTNPYLWFCDNCNWSWRKDKHPALVCIKCKQQEFVDFYYVGGHDVVILCGACKIEWRLLDCLGMAIFTYYSRKLR